MQLKMINPFIRAALIQPSIMEGQCIRFSYDYRLFYILEGTGDFITEKNNYPIEANTILLLRPKFGYHFRGRLRTIVLNFDMTRSAEARTEPICPVPSGLYSPSLLFEDISIDELSTPLILRNAFLFKDDLLEIIANANSENEILKIVASATLKKILALLADNRQYHSSAEKLCENIQNYIRSCASQIKGNHDIAKHFGYQTVYLAQLFKNTTGENLHQFVMTERLRIAKEWLIRTNQTIDEIAFGSGFASRSHFCTYFKEHIGCTPTQYRNQAWAKCSQSLKDR